MMRSLGAGGLLLALAGAAVAGPSFGAGFGAASAWAITPEDAACHTDLELVSRSGAVAPITLISDGDHVALRFAREGMPSEAFLPIRVDGKPYSNLVQRTGEEGLAVMNLSDDTLAALRHGKVLQVAWLADEAVSASLAGASQGIVDLRSCGAQVASQHRIRETELDVQRAKAQAETRAKAVADEQLAAARAQTAAAEADRQRVAAEAERARAEADALSARADQQRAAVAEQERQRYYYGDRQYYYSERPPAPQPEPAPWGYYRPYYPR
jgi:hypothetical protein